MEYMIVHRGDEIHKLQFESEEDGVLFLVSEPGIFHSIHGWVAEKVMKWLEERDFQHYWERDEDV